MKTFLLHKFETVFKDLRDFIAAQVPAGRPSPNVSAPVKIQEPNRPRQNSPQKTAMKKKATPKKDRSMIDSQGVQTFKGSGYKGKGNVDSSKQTLNRKRR